ncbi:MAG: glycosyltransferase family 9 protein [Caulobacter sp.]|nr:glycosyltransferase family 9 protein [Caulobacter sp.]
MANYEKILVIQAGTIGEFVLSLAAMRRIRQAHPRDRITLLTIPAFEALARSSPYVNDVDTGAAPETPGDWLALRKRIKAAKYARVYDLQGSSATNSLFQMLRPFPPPWSGPAKGAKFRHRNPNRDRMHLLERQAEQLHVAGIWPDAPVTEGDAPPPDLSWILRRAPEQRPTPGAQAPKPFVLLAPGGQEKSLEKRWPIAAFSDLAGRLFAAGYDIVIIGGPQDSALARTIQKTVGRARDLTGRTDFAQIALLGARAVLAVGNDTGPLHLIAAAGAPTVALFAGGPDSALASPRGHVAVLHAPVLSALAVDTVASACFSLLPR